MIHPQAAFRITVALAAMLVASAQGTTPAEAQTPQDLSALSDRVDRLQRDIDVLQRQLARQPGGAAARSGPAAAAPASDVPTSYIDRTEGRFDTIDGQIR